MLNKIIGVLLSMVMLVGCSSSIVKTQSGGYIENASTLPELTEEYGGIIGMLTTAEGKLQLYVNNEGIEVYELQEDAAWKQIQSLGESLGQVDGAVLDIAQDSNGKYYLAYMNTAGKCGISVIGENQAISELQLQWPSDLEQQMITSLEVTGEEQIYLSNEVGTIYQFNRVNGNYVRTYEGGKSFAIVNDCLYITSTSANELRVYDIQSGEEKGTIATDQIGEMTKLLAGGNSLYFINQNGICRLSEKDNKWERLMDSQYTSLGMPSLKLEYIEWLNDKFYAIFSNSVGEMQFKYYEYSKEFTRKTTEEISVYMLEDNMTVRQVVSQYEIEHPQVKVNLELGVNENQTKEDAIRSLNTQLLAGKGPDVLVLDGLPIDTYMEKGILADMRPWIEQGLNQGTWIENIITAYETDNKIAAIPTHFTLSTIWGAKDIVEKVNTVDELAQYALQHPEENVMLKQNAEQMIRQLSNMYCESWFNDEGQLDKESLQAFLEDIKVFAQEEKVDYGQGNSFGGANYQEIIHVAYDDAKVWLMKPLNVQDLLLAFTANKQRGDGDFAMFLAQQDKVFEPTSILGVNNNSKKQEVAEALITTALSENVQVVDTKEGFPVHVKALEDWGSGKGINKTQGSYYFTGTQTLSVDWGYEDEINDFIQYCKTVEYPAAANSAVVDLIVQETEDYFNGKLSIEETMRRVEQKIRLYLQE